MRPAGAGSAAACCCCYLSRSSVARSNAAARHTAALSLLYLPGRSPALSPLSLAARRSVILARSRLPPETGRPGADAPSHPQHPRPRLSTRGPGGSVARPRFLGHHQQLRRTGRRRTPFRFAGSRDERSGLVHFRSTRRGASRERGGDHVVSGGGHHAARSATLHTLSLSHTHTQDEDVTSAEWQITPLTR